MQIVFTTDDFQSAPPEVHSWISERLGFAPEPAKVTKPSTKKAAKSKSAQTKEPTKITLKEVMDRAVELIEAKGEDTLAEVLKNVGIDRVKECPEDKYADLLAEIAIHA